MSLGTYIKDGGGSKSVAKVTSAGQLVTTVIDFSTPFNVTANLNNVAFNLVRPMSFQKFIITAIIFTANKNVGASNAIVELYQASTETSTTVDTLIYTTEMIKNTTQSLTGLNLEVSLGTWLNVKTDDNDIFVTILGYYIEAPHD